MQEAAQQHVSILLNKIQVMDSRIEKLESLFASIKLPEAENTTFGVFNYN